MAGGDWLLVVELFERGDPSFVDELRRVHDADDLGAFAPRWFADTRPEARAALLDYLDRPLNAFRHEALVKRLFKLAEAAGDDEVMARFLVALDRSVRRKKTRHLRYSYLEFDTISEAEETAAAWRDNGVEFVSVWQNYRQKYQVSGRWSEPGVKPDTQSTMPRGKLVRIYDISTYNPKTRQMQFYEVPDWVTRLRLPAEAYRGVTTPNDQARKGLAKLRLFTTPTRQYLRRRAWRYFRRLGRNQPGRYVPAVAQALALYRDGDVPDGLALLDNWGLVHALFHHAPALHRGRRYWDVADGHTLAELEPAPMFAKLWAQSPGALVGLLTSARCRAVRAWVVRMIRRDPAAVLPAFPIDQRLALLAHDDPEVVALATDLVRDDPALADVPVARWLELLATASPAALELIAGVLEKRRPEGLSLPEVIGLACARPIPVARLGLRWLQVRSFDRPEDAAALLNLDAAQSDPVRADLVSWARGVLSASPAFEPGWVLRWLDSPAADVRAEGWAWLQAEPRVRESVDVWRKLAETPYDDVRFHLVAELESRVNGATDREFLGEDGLRRLWATVLLNVQRGGRSKPAVVRQVVRRAEERPEELPTLLPLLAAALRSVRGPEWRAGLAAVVRLAESNDAAGLLVRASFPELQLG